MRLPRSPLVLAFVATTFLFSGFILNLIQLTTLLLVWPVSRSAYRRLNGFLVNFHWTEVIWLAEWWANVRLRVFCEKDVVPTLGRDRAVALCNHASDVDWLLGWMLAHNYDCLGGAKCVLKSLLMYVPVLGWSWWFLEYIFIQRNWEKDRRHLAKSCATLGDFPMPFWVVIFAEGTRFTAAKQLESAAFCRERGYPELKNVLFPRTKGWNLTMAEMRKYIDCVYDVTFAFPPNQVTDVGDLINGVSQEVFAYIRRTPIKELPEGEEACEKWCIDTFYKMDERVENFKAEGQFRGHEELQVRRVLPLLVISGWAALLLGLLLAFFLPSVLAGEFAALYILAATIVGGDLFIRLLLWFAKKSASSKSKSKERRAKAKAAAPATTD